MSKKLDVREYQLELIRVVDGDTIDCYIDLGFNIKIKIELDTWVSILGNLEQEI